MVHVAMELIIKGCAALVRQEKNDFVLTTSGYEYDKELARVSIKVVPALQALIANQHDLAETLLQNLPEKKIFLETHLAELSIVEETIAKAHAKYRLKKEEAKKFRQEKENSIKMPANSPPEYTEPVKETDVLLDEMAAKYSPGLPSSRFDGEKIIPVLNKENDVRRIAIGASIKALRNLLGRELTNDEISVIEKQVDSYL